MTKFPDRKMRLNSDDPEQLNLIGIQFTIQCIHTRLKYHKISQSGMNVKVNGSTIPGFEAENSFGGGGKNQYVVRNILAVPKRIRITPQRPVCWTKEECESLNPDYWYCEPFGSCWLPAVGYPISV